MVITPNRSASLHKPRLTFEVTTTHRKHVLSRVCQVVTPICPKVPAKIKNRIWRPEMMKSMTWKSSGLC
jgi:hypothetical protein